MTITIKNKTITGTPNEVAELLRLLSPTFPKQSSTDTDVLPDTIRVYNSDESSVYPVHTHVYF